MCLTGLVYICEEHIYHSSIAKMDCHLSITQLLSRWTATLSRSNCHFCHRFVLICFRCRIFFFRVNFPSVRTRIIMVTQILGHSLQNFAKFVMFLWSTAQWNEPICETGLLHINSKPWTLVSKSDDDIWELLLWDFRSMCIPWSLPLPLPR